MVISYSICLIDTQNTVNRIKSVATQSRRMMRIDSHFIPAKWPNKRDCRMSGEPTIITLIIHIFCTMQMHSSQYFRFHSKSNREKHRSSYRLMPSPVAPRFDCC